MTKKASNIQIAGDHYRKFAIQPSEFIQRNGLNWCEGNVIKYVSRWREKNGEQDIDKAIHYLNLLKEWEFPAQTAAPMTLAELTKINDADVESCATEQCANYSRIFMRNCDKYDSVAILGCGKRSVVVAANAPKVVAGMADCVNFDESNCVDCHHCDEYVQSTPPTREPLDLRLPSYALPCTAEEAEEKYREECREWGNCLAGTLESIIEAWDVMQAAQTWSQIAQSKQSARALASASDRLSQYYYCGGDAMKGRRILLIKLAARAKYSPADCARILADV